MTPQLKNDLAELEELANRLRDFHQQITGRCNNVGTIIDRGYCGFVDSTSAHPVASRAGFLPHLLAELASGLQNEVRTMSGAALVEAERRRVQISAAIEQPVEAVE